MVTNPLKVLEILKDFKHTLYTSPYFYFVSKVTDIPECRIKEFMPKGRTKRLLMYAFQNSISPLSGESPLHFEAAMALYLVTRITKPDIVIETGVSAGRSTSFILAALHDNRKGHLFSIDIDPNAGYAIPADLKYRWTFICQPSENALPKLCARAPIDIFLHDSLHTYENMMFEYKTVWPALKKGGMLFSHDISWNSAFNDFKKSVLARPIYLDKNFAVLIKL